MDWLGSWLKEIVLVILIAAFVDLLLPNSSMQRYVKLVVGLFILLTMLTPLIRLLQGGWTADRLGYAIESLQRQHEAANGASAMKTLEQVMAEADRLKQQEEAKAKRAVESQIAEQIRVKVESAFDRQVRDVAVETEIDGKSGKPDIRSIRIGLAAEKPPDPGVEGGPDRAIEEVRPVDIRIDAGGGSKDAAESGSSVDGSRSSAAEQRLTGEVARQVAAEWGISARRVDVRIDAEAEGGDRHGQLAANN